MSPRLAIYGGIFAGALLLSSSAANWILWSALQSEQKAHAKDEAAVSQCAATNTDNQRVIDGLNDSLNACVREREASRTRWAEAIARRAGQIEALEARLAREEREREELDATCPDWMSQRICGPVADRVWE